MSLAKRMQSTATRLLSTFDEREVKARLLRYGGSVWDPIEEEYTQPTITEHPITGVATSYSKALVNGTTIQGGDIKFIATHEEKPTTADKLRLDGVEYEIISVDPKAYTGLDLVVSYEIQLRK